MKKIVLQDNQLNQLVSRVTEGLLSGASFPNGHVTGEEILTFAKHQQVNKFVLFQIYQDWSAHMQKLAHPYFNYNHPDVIKGLKSFQNTISDHIQVPVQDFRKMLQQAVYNSIKLILNPEDAIGNFFFRDTEAIHSEMYNKHAAYFKDFDFVILALQRFFEKNNQKRIEKALYFEKFQKVVGIYETKNKLGELDYQRNLFNSLTGQDLEQFLKKAASIPAKEPTTKRIQVNPVGSGEAKAAPVSKPVQETPKPVEKPPVESKPAVEKKAVAPVNVEPPKENSTVDKPAAESKPQTVSDAFKEGEGEGAKSLNESFSNSGKSILERSQEALDQNKAAETPKRKVASLLQQPARKDKAGDKPAGEGGGKDSEGGEKKSTIDLFAERKKEESRLKEQRTVADKLKNSNDGKTLNEQIGEAKTIRTDQIPVHKQFQFVQKVFGGSSVKFKVVLDKINKTETIEEADSVLERYVFNDPGVNRNDKVCQEFESLVRNRFG